MELPYSLPKGNECSANEYTGDEEHPYSESKVTCERKEYVHKDDCIEALRERNDALMENDTLRAENKRLRDAVQYAVAQFDLPQDQYSRLELSAIEKLKRALDGKK